MLSLIDEVHLDVDELEALSARDATIRVGFFFLPKKNKPQLKKHTTLA